ncbi:uncharacterized protein LOC111354072 [Spodoptera litura]|uniref:Uncharacterized protein LOC111354072 n=1 Tax=Spodoptera litura TaxID=69820 RepID=A0A9J7E2Y5_SPOLT|nr:uncharacterized protein LOC111354072 [Spodoptera litura]
MGALTILLIIATTFSPLFGKKEEKEVAKFEMDIPGLIDIFSAAKRELERSKLMEMFSKNQIAQNILQQVKEYAETNPGKTTATRRTLWKANLRTIPRTEQKLEAARRGRYSGHIKQVLKKLDRQFNNNKHCQETWLYNFLS